MVKKSWRTRTKGTDRQKGKRFKVSRGKMKGASKSAVYDPYLDFEKYRHLELYHAQDGFIEHQYPIEGVPELLISHAGDVFREISQGHPPDVYTDEKITRLERDVFENGMSGHWEEMSYYKRKSNYDLRRTQYQRNLNKLKEETIKTEMDVTQKKLLMQCLKTIEGLMQWYDYESSTYRPEKDVKQLRKDLEEYEKRRKVKWVREKV